MKKKQFLERLEQLLAGLPQEEREEAMSWYRDYLDDAGEEQEAEVIARLGSPEDVANSILANLKGNEPGGFTETGYESFPQRKVPAKQEDVKRDRRTAYDGPYEYIPRQERQSGTQQPSGGRQYSDAQRQGGPQAGTADPRGPQADQARRQGGASAGRRTGSGTGRPAWVTVLLTLAGVAGYCDPGHYFLHVWHRRSDLRVDRDGSVGFWLPGRRRGGGRYRADFSGGFSGGSGFGDCILQTGHA